VCAPWTLTVKKATTMRTIFKMTGPANAVLHEGDQEKAVSIPASAMVVLLDGNISEDAVVKIRFGGKVLHMLSSQLRHGSEQWGRCW
jgi:hypothetical protein